MRRAATARIRALRSAPIASRNSSCRRSRRELRAPGRAPGAGGPWGSGGDRGARGAGDTEGVVAWVVGCLKGEAHGAHRRAQQRPHLLGLCPAHRAPVHRHHERRRSGASHQHRERRAAGGFGARRECGDRGWGAGRELDPQPPLAERHRPLARRARPHPAQPRARARGPREARRTRGRGRDRAVVGEGEPRDGRGARGAARGRGGGADGGLRVHGLQEQPGLEKQLRAPARRRGRAQRFHAPEPLCGEGAREHEVQRF